MGLIGTYLASQAAKKVDDARTAVFNDEQQRQAGYNGENNALNTQSQDRYVDFGTQQTQRGQQLGDYFAAPSATGGSKVMLPGATSDLLANELAKRMALSKAYTGQQATALGNLRSFGDLMGTIGRSQAQDAGKISEINNFKRGSASVVPYELDAAGHAGDTYKFWGDIANGLEKVGTTAALSGGLSGLPGMFGLTNQGGLGVPGAFATQASMGGGAGGGIFR